MDEALVSWLNTRFRKTNRKGVYSAHQPIYGFRCQPSEEFHLFRYTLTTALLSVLSGLDFSNLLDVGSAEGYKAFLAQYFFRCHTTVTDLSAEACERAREIFGLIAKPGDVCALPFEDKSFDAVMSSATLEHVPDLHRAAGELLRVARKAVVISVPHDPTERIEGNIRNQVMHGHVHALDLHSFDFVRDLGWQVSFSTTACNFWLSYVNALADGTHKPVEGSWKRECLIAIYNVWATIARLAIPRPLAGRLVDLDPWACSRSSRFKEMLFVLTRDQETWKGIRRRFCFRDIATLIVKPHRLPHS